MSAAKMLNSKKTKTRWGTARYNKIKKDMTTNSMHSYGLDKGLGNRRKGYKGHFGNK